MANEKRLIDANELYAKLGKMAREPYYQHDGEDYYVGIADASGAVAESPTVDAVEVVRCKDCKEWLRNRGVADSPNGHCFYHETHMNGYDFCSYGERKDNG